jgi:hypothetical protein
MADNEKNLIDAASFINPKKYSKRVRRLKIINNFIHYLKLITGLLLTIFILWFLIAVMFSI